MLFFWLMVGTVRYGFDVALPGSFWWMWTEFQHFDRVGKVPRSHQAASCQDCAGVDAEGAEGTSITSTCHRIQVFFFGGTFY